MRPYSITNLFINFISGANFSKYSFHKFSIGIRHIGLAVISFTKNFSISGHYDWPQNYLQLSRTRRQRASNDVKCLSTPGSMKSFWVENENWKLKLRILKFQSKIDSKSSHWGNYTSHETLSIKGFLGSTPGLLLESWKRWTKHPKLRKNPGKEYFI